MADDNEQIITGQGGPEAAQVHDTPDNVVTDNTGVVLVQPIATTDPTITDNTNPKVFFDGGDPANIPPHDSNEQLHIAAGKRIGAETTGLSTSAEVRREAVSAAYDNSKDVRDVVGDGDETPTPAERLESGQAALQRAQAQGGNRVTSPTGRAGTAAKQQKTGGTTGGQTKANG